MSLGIAPEGGQAAHTDHRRGQGLDTRGGHAVVHQTGQLVGTEEHHQEGQHAQGQEQGHSQPEGPPDLILTAQGVGLAHQLGYRHRQSRGGDGKQHGVDVIGVAEVCGPLLANDVEQRDLIKQTDQLDHQDPGRQHGGAAEEGILLRALRHAARGMAVLGHGKPPFRSGGGPVRLRRPSRYQKSGAGHNSPPPRGSFPDPG